MRRTLGSDRRSREDAVIQIGQKTAGDQRRPGPLRMREFCMNIPTEFPFLKGRAEQAVREGLNRVPAGVQRYQEGDLHPFRTLWAPYLRGRERDRPRGRLGSPVRRVSEALKPPWEEKWTLVRAVEESEVDPGSSRPHV